jgi:hypothetical protein
MLHIAVGSWVQASSKEARGLNIVAVSALVWCGSLDFVGLEFVLEALYPGEITLWLNPSFQELPNKVLRYPPSQCISTPAWSRDMERLEHSDTTLSACRTLPPVGVLGRAACSVPDVNMRTVRARSSAKHAAHHCRGVVAPVRQRIDPAPNSVTNAARPSLTQRQHPNPPSPISALPC